MGTDLDFAAKGSAEARREVALFSHGIAEIWYTLRHQTGRNPSVVASNASMA